MAIDFLTGFFKDFRRSATNSVRNRDGLAPFATCDKNFMSSIIWFSLNDVAIEMTLKQITIETTDNKPLKLIWRIFMIFLLLARPLE